MKIIDGVYMLEIPSTNRMGHHTIIHPTLLSEGDQVILIDCGFPGQAALIRQAIEETGTDLSQLKTIILTHQDLDHTGAAAAIKEELPDVQFWSHRAEQHYIQGDWIPAKIDWLTHTLADQPEEARDFYQSMLANSRNFRVPIARTLQDGEELPMLGGMRVIHTPGHTPGHISLYLRQHRLLISGDAFRVVDGNLQRMSPDFNLDTGWSVRSMQRLQEYPIETAICYHGGLFRGDVNVRLTELIGGN
jgi:glyoxylase-like metal-dependent hydrolase (beta-lactamase superfamily II)